LMEGWAHVDVLRRNIAQMAAALGFSPDWSTPIFPVVLGTEAAAMHAMECLQAAGFYVVGIRPPTVPPGACRLRLTVTAAHTPKQIADVAAAVRSVAPNYSLVQATHS